MFDSCESGCEKFDDDESVRYMSNDPITSLVLPRDMGSLVAVEPIVMLESLVVVAGE